jgi:phosphoenolpyruvate carboxylase
MAPRWFGAGTALQRVSEQFGEALLAEMFSKWFFFGNLIDDIELSLARADMGIAAAYDTLVDDSYRRFIPVLRAEYDLAQQIVLKLRGCARLLDSEPTVQRSIRLRNPYIDPMHLMQVDLLRRWRETGRTDRDLYSALLSAVGGISRALQGT